MRVAFERDAREREQDDRAGGAGAEARRAQSKLRSVVVITVGAAGAEPDSMPIGWVSPIGRAAAAGAAIAVTVRATAKLRANRREWV